MCQSESPACLQLDAGLTSSLTVVAPTVLMTWSSNCNVKTTTRRDGMFGDDGPVSRCSVFSLHGAFRRGGSVLGLCHTAIWQLQAKARGRARRVLFVCSFTHTRLISFHFVLSGSLRSDIWSWQPKTARLASFRSWLTSL